MCVYLFPSSREYMLFDFLLKNIVPCYKMFIFLLFTLEINTHSPYMFQLTQIIFFNSFNSKILDPDMSPLGFDAKKLYHFVYVRFTKTSAKVQEQALNWLQVTYHHTPIINLASFSTITILPSPLQSLTVLEIVIPLPLMFSMFADGVKMMRGSKEEQEKPLEKTTKTTTKPEEKKSPIST